MPIMAMAMVKQINNSAALRIIILLAWLINMPFAFSGDWQFTPSLGLEETFTDNVELTTIDPTSSFVTQTILGLDAKYESRVASLNFSGTNSYLFFSHDNEIDDNYFTLDADGQYLILNSGLAIVANANVSNVSRSSANNGLADLVSGDTIQSETYSSGLQYRAGNSSYSIDSSIVYTINTYEDEIGDYNGATATFNSVNGNNARSVFWQLASSFSTKNQSFSGETRTGEQYIIDAQLGFITSVNINPFIRFYDEGLSGDFINQNRQTTSSWGPGVRWLVSKHLKVDLSYNYVADNTVSDDYVAAFIAWEPSSRTSMSAGYSKRFFGDSYDLNIKHTTKRLTNTVTYNETLEVFDRNNYQQVPLGIFWCPSNSSIEGISPCFSSSEPPLGLDDYQLVSLFNLEPIESNEFSLNKRFAWSSQLQLARTLFAIDTSASRRESLETNIVDDNLSASFTVKRKISGKSDLTFLAKYNYLIFDKENPTGSRQEDHYKTISAIYTKALASSLSTNFTIQHVNRDSTIEQYTYDEIRAIINITKDF